MAFIPLTWELFFVLFCFVLFYDRSKWGFAEESKMIHKLEGGMKTSVLGRKGTWQLWASRKEELPECHFRISRRQ